MRPGGTDLGAGRPVADSTRGEAPRSVPSPSGHLAEVLREHRAPRVPVVAVVLAPGVHAVRDALAAERVGHRPRRARVLVVALARRDDDEALAELRELRRVAEAREE